MNNGMMQAQQSLQAGIADQQRAYQELADQKTADANNQIAVSEQAMRIRDDGPPPPEKSAEAPKIGDKDRYGAGAEGEGVADYYGPEIRKVPAKHRLRTQPCVSAAHTATNPTTAWA